MTEWRACLTLPPQPPLPKEKTKQLTFYVFIYNLVNKMNKKNFMPKLLLDGPFQHNFKRIYYIKDVYKSLVWVFAYACVCVIV